MQTATGKEIKTNYVAESTFVNQLFVRVEDMSYMDVAKIFSDKNETKRLLYNERWYSDYTNLIGIMPEAAGYKVILAKEN